MRQRIVAAGDGLPTEVVVVEPTGADTQLFCKFGEQQVVAVVRDRVTCAPGERIGLQPDLAKVHVFDAESGKRLSA